MKTIKKIIEFEGLLIDGELSWDCPTSPTKHCQYDEITDPVYDHCIHCGLPHERK